MLAPPRSPGRPRHPRSSGAQSCLSGIARAVPHEWGGCSAVDQDVLVVAADTADGREALADLRARGLLSHLLPPRLALVDPGGAGLAEIAGTLGISVHVDTPPKLPDASEAERLFVDAWLSRRAGKTRRGDGLPWDAPGYEPPG
jgi:hypothetical protein